MSEFEMVNEQLCDYSCDECISDAETIASCVCLQCLTQLCPEHQETHLRNRFTSKHKLVLPSPIDDMIRPKMERHRSVLKFAETCDYHSPAIKNMYCRDCNIVVCQLCVFIENHADHALRFVTDIHGSIAKEMLDVHVVSSKKNAGLVEGKKSTLETWKAKISKKYQSHLQLLDTEMQDAKERLEKEYAEKKAFLVTRYSKALSNLDDFHADTCEILDGFDEWEKNVKSVVEEKNPFPLLEKKKALEVSLAGLVKRGTELDPFAIKGIPYLKTVPSAVEGPLLSFGRSCSYSQPHECQVSFPKRPCRVYCRRN